MTDGAFFDAVVAGDARAVAATLDADPALLHAVAPERFDDQGGPQARALHLAAFHGHADVERLLVERGFDPATLSGEGRTALHVALECNNTTRELLLELGCPLDVCAAAALQDLARLDALLAERPELANDMTTGLSPLGWAAYFGAEDSVRRLLAAGATQADFPLYCAAQVAQLGVAKLLVEGGADPSAVCDDVGGNALHMAVLMRHTCDATEFVRWLLDECGVDPRATTADGRTARQLAELHAARQAEAGVERGHERWRPFAPLAELLRDAEERGAPPAP